MRALELTVVAALYMGTLWVGVVPTENAADTHRCSRQTIGLATAERPRILIKALADSAVSPGQLNPSAYATEGDWEAAAEHTDVWGRLAVVERNTGLEREVTIGDTVLLVPWAYRADCGRVVWTDGASWIPPGERGVVWVAPRPRYQWVSGTATFDLWAWHAPYPWGQFLRYDRLYPREEPAKLLTVNELWTLLDVLPTEAEMVADTAMAVRRVRSWETANPGLAARFPAVRLLFDLRYRLGLR